MHWIQCKKTAGLHKQKPDGFFVKNKKTTDSNHPKITRLMNRVQAPATIRKARIAAPIRSAVFFLSIFFMTYPLLTYFCI